MSNAGFSNLATLKAQLLAPSLVAATDFDARILALGLGVASAFENFCNRKFARTAGDTEILAADRVEFLLRRYPVEAVSKLELKLTEAGGWTELVINDVVSTIDLVSGILHFAGNADVGPYFAQVRVTYTGGYFWEQLEPTDNGYPTAQPNGSAALPEDLRLAFFLQCKRTWESIDKIGDKISEVGPSDKEGRSDLGVGGLALAPIVKQMLQQFVRYNLV